MQGTEIRVVRTRRCVPGAVERLADQQTQQIFGHDTLLLEIHQLGAVVHPQSIVHSLVTYRDGSVLAQLACPDMRTPIALSLSWPYRMDAPTERLDLVKLGTLTFEAPDESRFPSLRIAREALEKGGAAPAILNAANEIAVAAFLGGRIGFMDIPRRVGEVLEQADAAGLTAAPETLSDVLAVDAEARRMASALLGTHAPLHNC